MEFETSKYRKRRGNKFFFFIFIIFCVGLCVVISHFFSSIISTGSISFTSFTSASSSEYSLFAVSLGSYTTKAQADDYAVSIRSKNAGGYVYNLNGKFYVVASIYEKKNDAESVANNLTTAGNTPEILELKVDKVNFNKISSSNIKKEFNDMMISLKETYLKMYDISVSIDTSVYSESKAKIEIDALKTTLQTNLDKMSNGASSNDGVYYVIIKNKTQKVIEELDEIIEFNSTDTFPISAKVKNTYISIVIDILDLVELLNQE